MTETSFHPPEVTSPTAAVLSQLAALPVAERRVADALLRDTTAATYESVGDLAARAGSSPATVIRLSRRLGFKGFTSLKLALAEESGRSQQFGHGTTGGAPGTLARTLRTDAGAIADAAAIVDPVAFDRAVAALVRTRDVAFGGVGTSAALAELVALRFMALGIRVVAFKDVLMQHMAAAALQPGTAAVLISHTGASRDTVAFAQAARSAGATTIAITSFAGSPLAETCDISLVSGNRQDPSTLELFANRVVHLSVLGALHTGVAAELGTVDAAARRAAASVAEHQF